MKKMKLYRPKTAIGRYYSILFSLPHWELLAAVLIGISVIALYGLRERAVPLLLNTVLIILFLEAYRVFYPLTVFHKLKRIIGLSLTVLIYTLIYYLLLGDWILVVTASSTIVITVIQGLDGTKWWRYIIAVAPSFTSIVLSMWITSGVVSHSGLVKAFLLILLFIIADYLIYLVMSRHRINGYKAPDLGTLFLQNWLERRKDIEKVIDELSTSEGVHPRLIFMDGLLIIYTDLHYGPFSNTGSSELPGELKKLFSSLGYSVVALHGFGSHDRNLASSRYLRDYVRKIYTAVIDAEKTKLRYHGALKLTGGDNWEALALVFDRLTIVFVSRPVKGIDDIPYNLFFRYNVIARKRGLGDLILVDAHNWEKQEDFDLGELDKLLDEVVEKAIELKKRPPVEVLFRYKCFETSAPGLIQGDACIIEVTGEGRERVVLLYLRGNNMKPGSREKLIDVLGKTTGADYVEVFTNDEHSETGVRSSLAYIPIHDSPELLRDTEVAARELVGMPYRLGAWYSSTRFDTKLMGYTAVMLEKLLMGSYIEATILLLSYAFLLPVLLAVFKIAH